MKARMCLSGVLNLPSFRYHFLSRPLSGVGDPKPAAGAFNNPKSKIENWLIGCALGLAAVLAPSQALAQPATFGGSAQHTGQYSPAAQHLNQVHWSTRIDTTSTGASSHYGAPLVTPANTVLVPVRSATGYGVKAFDGATGRLKYTLTSDYLLPSYNWVPVYQPVLAMPPSGPRLYYPGAGGTVYYIENPDSDTPGSPVQQCFYMPLADYHTNAAAFNSTVFVNTALTADTNGAVFFGFRVQTNGAPAPLSTTNGGYARLAPEGTATYVLAGAAAGDHLIGRDSHNCAPALSNDGTTLYVPVKAFSTANYGYLLGLDTTTLVTKYKVFLKDPRNGNPAGLLDDSTASPVVAPDGDVFYGVFGNPNNGSRGFLLHFSSDLAVEKPPGAFGWDNTPALVPRSMVPAYTGSSDYLLFSKYNNYAGNTDGDGINRLALLDPNATQLDPHPTAPGLVEMREVLTVLGCTPDAEYQGSVYPYAVREWCINASAVNPATDSILMPSEDGRIYRWDLASNALTESLVLGTGLGEPYVPAVVGPDGTVYTLNGGTLFALGGWTNISVAVYSSTPDQQRVVTGQPVTFTAVVTNLNALGPAPTGTITFQDLTYLGLSATNRTLASAVPLTNGLAAVTVPDLLAASNCLGNHFITATYSGDTNFSSASATRVQKVHASASALVLTSTGPVPTSQAVTFSATVAPTSPFAGTPTGMLAFWDGTNFLAQFPLDTNGTATLTLTNLAGASHALRATYASDTQFDCSSQALLGMPPTLVEFRNAANGSIQLSFTNISGAPFSILSSSVLAVPLADWANLGAAIEAQPGQFQFIDSSLSNQLQGFYRVRSP